MGFEPYSLKPQSKRSRFPLGDVTARLAIMSPWWEGVLVTAHDGRAVSSGMRRFSVLARCTLKLKKTYNLRTLY